jgi:ABC-2 type transport system ATP-binding protein
MGFIRPSGGSVRVFGERRVAQAHPRVGYIPERQVFETRFTGREHLDYLALLSGLDGEMRRARVREVLERVHLTAAADRRSGGYSKGMLQRLAIAQALLTDPDLLILDEPTSGLDPLGQWEVRQIIAALHGQGKTIILCSHYLAEVESLCDTVGILRRGRLVQLGAVADLLRAEETVEIVLAEGTSVAEVAARLALGGEAVAGGARLRIPQAEQQRVLAALVAAGITLRSLNPVSETLEDVYVRAASAGGGPQAPALALLGMSGAAADKGQQRGGR